MEIEKGKTIKYIKEQHTVPQEVKDQLKSYNRIKKMILSSVKSESKTIPQLSQELDLPAHEVMFQLMSFLKYGMVEVDKIDDDDEYFYYKAKSNG
ncbi:MAG: hypothetical protein J7L96_08985 [Bacteroidales bacterium]|nr:hypothetical protein [Bacteroidales bacterium]